MATISSVLTNILTVSWRVKTTNTISGTGERSPNFSLFDDQWHLQLSYYRYINSPEFQLSLLQGTRMENLRRCIRVTVFCSSQNDENSNVKGATTLLHTSGEVICIINHTMVSNIFDYPVINVVCIFHDVTPTLSVQKIEKAILGPDLDSFSLDFSNLLKDETFADVKLRCGNQTVQAHKTVLCARSEVFAAMFRNKMAENKSGIVELNDMDAKVLRLFLRYIYTGKIEKMAEDLVPEIYAASDKYAVYALKKTCSNHMVGCLTEENCTGILALADGHADSDFKAQVIDFICRHEKVLLKNVWLKFSRENAPLAVEVYESFAKKKIQA